MTYENLLYVGGGLVGGVLLFYIYLKIKWVYDAIKTLEDNCIDLDERVLDPEEMATKILTMKMAINKLPPELMEQIKAEAEGGAKPPSVGKDGMSYVG